MGTFYGSWLWLYEPNLLFVSSLLLKCFGRNFRFLEMAISNVAFQASTYMFMVWILVVAPKFELGMIFLCMEFLL